MPTRPPAPVHRLHHGKRRHAHRQPRAAGHNISTRQPAFASAALSAACAGGQGSNAMPAETLPAMAAVQQRNLRSVPASRRHDPATGLPAADAHRRSPTAKTHGHRRYRRPPAIRQLLMPQVRQRRQPELASGTSTPTSATALPLRSAQRVITRRHNSRHSSSASRRACTGWRSACTTAASQLRRIHASSGRMSTPGQAAQA